MYVHTQKPKGGNGMVRKINLNGMERKELVKVIEKITGKKGVYLKPPTFSYRIGKILVLKDGSVQCPDDSDIFERLAEWSIFCEPEELELTVELPDTLTEEQKENLERLVKSKATSVFCSPSLISGIYSCKSFPKQAFTFANWN